MILFGPTQNKLSYNPPSVVIGTQTWALQNFAESTLINGTVLTNVTDNSAWAALTSEGWCNYNNNPAIGAVYGKLYNWYCCALIDAAYNPFGWRVATKVDWDTLIAGQGGASVAGQKLKESGTTHWNMPNTGNNSSGFTAYGSGFRSSTGGFQLFKDRCYFFTSTQSSSTNAMINYLINTDNNIVSIGLEKKRGCSIRLIKI